MLLLIGLPASALSDTATRSISLHAFQFAAASAITMVLALFFLFVPVTRFPTWAKLVTLMTQCGMIAALQLLVPSPSIGYLFLVVVMQAVYLFGVWVWVPINIAIWMLWGSTAIIVAQDWLEWLGNNLYAVFLIVAVTLAAAVYTAQHRFKQQIEMVVQRLQDQYAALASRIEQTEQRAMLEERQRIMRTINGELQSALRSLEQTVGGAIAQAQVSIVQAQQMLQQTQTSAREAVEHVRSTLQVLRPGDGTAMTSTVGGEGDLAQVAALRSAVHPLTWRVITLLPLIFICMVPVLVLLERPVAPGPIWQGIFFSLLMLAWYLCAQARLRGPWFQVGVIGQVGTLMIMTLLTHVVPLMLGTAVIATQIAMRANWGGMTTWFVLLQGATLLVVSMVDPTPWHILASLLLFGIVSAAFIFPIMSARRRSLQSQSAAGMLRNLSDQLEALRAQERSLREMAIVAERHRVAREIHDTLGHYLMAIGIQIRVAQELLVSEPEHGLEHLQELRQLVREAQQSLDGLLDPSASLPGATNLLQEALGVLVQQYNLCPNSEAELQIRGAIDPLPADVGLTLYRAAQEGLTNAANHGQATRITISLERYPSMISLTVRDNGVADPAVSTKGNGMGLQGLRERASLLGGICESYQAEDGGFVLVMEIPLTESYP